MFHQPVSQRWMFLRKFIESPRQIGSITPSSKALSRKMVNCVDWRNVEFAAELGAGTGVITRWIDEARQEGAKVLLFEKDPNLRTGLMGRYPDYPCYEEARRLHDILQEEGIKHLDCIVSGLPFANFNTRLRDELLDQIKISLKPGGLFVAFQYSLQMKKALKDKFEIKRIRLVLGNLPPAFVYVCRKPMV